MQRLISEEMEELIFEEMEKSIPSREMAILREQLDGGWNQ